MEKNMYILMHRDDPVVMVEIDQLSGAMLRIVKPKERELLPLGGCMDADMLRKWWQRRAVPIGQGKIRHILHSLGIPSPQSYLVKNLGLSLTDHYWIKPTELEVAWADINLFTNEFRDPVGDLQFDESDGTMTMLQENMFSPSSSVQGELRKKWIIADGKRCLIKGNHGGNSQESLNEVVATLIHRKQAAFPHVMYSAVKLGEQSQICCFCESFTSENVEFIPAIDVVDSQKKANSVSMYEHFIRICVEHGLEEKDVRSFMEYQILADFVLTNIDRHLNNFGVLRDTETLRFVGMAPIFDSGNSMFWQNPLIPEGDDLTEVEVNSFRRKEHQLLGYVQDRKLLQIEKLPTEDELREIYEGDPLISHTDSILKGYRKKVELLEKFQENDI